MRQLHPTYREDVSDETLRALYAYPADRPWVRANMVSTVDGAATVAGRSEALSTPADKRVFGLLRGLSDVVLVGAGTARAEGYRALGPRSEYAGLRASLGQRPSPVLALVSGRLDLDPSSELFGGAGERTVVVTSASSDPAARERLTAVADVVVTGDDTVDLAAAVRTLADRGLTRVLCEGGPGLLGDVTAAGVLDELCLTVTPLLAVGGAHRITSGPDGDTRGLRLASVLNDDDVLLLRYLS